uniref:uncharacterized protein LOC122590756 n=1 Tax=Erigeron canadensis TaxID=72917 RepID=UPI001CB9566D|nr:uncharacterized protein LOC122590756 [Erigeron canadensis]
MRVAQDEAPVRPPGFFRRTTLVRRRVGANDRLMRHYFSENPTYNERQFRRRFRMSKRLFLKISGDLEAEYPYFQQRYDAAGKLGFSAIQKCTSALRQLATGQTGDFSTSSIDYMHWAWDMCPTAWRGTHTRGDVGHPLLMFQVVASYDLWIWNAYFGKQGSNNDINVFESSPVLEEIISGLAPTSSFYANGNFYKCGYYLTEGIYPEYTTFVKSFTDPFDEKRQLFKRKHDSARKAIERAFGVLKKR